MLVSQHREERIAEESRNMLPCVGIVLSLITLCLVGFG